MARISVTVIDVGVGDCIFIEAEDDDGNLEFGLIDCPDQKNYKPGYSFVVRSLERILSTRKICKPVFKFVMMSHSHDDHCNGLDLILRKFGTEWFLFGPASSYVAAAHVLKFANRARQSVTNVRRVDAISGLPFTYLGNARMSILFPGGGVPNSNENNNSVVLTLQQDSRSILLTGDVEVGCWTQIATPNDTEFIKVPHHGAYNGSLVNHSNRSPWIGHPNRFSVAISCHPLPHGHPHPAVISALILNHHPIYRTDINKDITVTINRGVLTAAWNH